MWLTCSSIGRKFVMAVTGVALVLFVTFHVLMNSVALIWPTAYNQVCEFLGANWYALAASAGLALLFIIHIIYAIWLTLQNRAARGTDRYAVTSRPPQVEWSSKNMLVLGIVVVAFLIVHLIQFWAKMQLQEICEAELNTLPQIDGTPCSPAMGTLFLQMAFSEIWTPIVYIIGFVALWFHMTHGFWSMFHTVGWDNNRWINRLKTIGCWWTSIVIVLFIAQALAFTVRAQSNYYLENEALQEQYSEFWSQKADEVIADFESRYYALVGQEGDQMQQQQIQMDFISNELPAYVERAKYISNAYKQQCGKIAPTAEMQQLERFTSAMEQQIQMVKMFAKQPATQQAQQAQPAETTPAENQDTNE